MENMALHINIQRYSHAAMLHSGDCFATTFALSNMHSIFQKHTHMHKFCGFMLLLFATQFRPLDGECEKTKSKFTVFHIRTRLLRFCFLIMVFGEIFPMQQWYIVLSYCSHLWLVKDNCYNRAHIRWKSLFSLLMLYVYFSKLKCVIYIAFEAYSQRIL